jgi:hypothetical protein
MTKCPTHCEGWFEGHRWKHNNKWFTKPSKLSFKHYNIHDVSLVKINNLALGRK